MPLRAMTRNPYSDYWIASQECFLFLTLAMTLAVYYSLHQAGKERLTMNKAIGMIEYKTVSSGIMAADKMVKTALVEIIEAQTVCPGKYIAVISGELSAVKAAIDAAKADFSEQLISSFVLGNPHEAIFPAIYGATDITELNALGILETYDAASIIVAADVAAKTAFVDLIELRIAKGMCGKSYLMLTGEVAAVQAAIDRAKTHIGDEGMYLDSSVIARPDEKICRAIL